MMPLDRCMDSYPHQMSQMPFTPHNHPGLDATPSQMKIDPRGIPGSYNIWPYGGNYGYPFPCHGCCNHGYTPGYYGCRPPYPHFPQPFPFNYHGAYPQFPEPYHVSYGPHQLYPMEQPRYEYEKNAAGNHHCCGCPNHTCNDNNKNFKIEEQKPELNGKSSESLVPIELKTSPYPVVWFPPGYLKNREHGKPFESNKNWDEVPLEKKSQNQLDVDRNRFSLPIIWMPSDDKLEKSERDNHKELNASQESVEAWPSQSRVVPWKSPNSDENEKILRAIEGNPSNDRIEPKISEKSVNRKSIPVKQMEPLHGEIRMTSEGNETKGREMSVMHAENSCTGKPSESCIRRQSSSPPKTSKLPPICLRVDPLPRRKNGNGSSRSTSPPGQKGKSHEAPDKMVNASALTGTKEDIQQCPQFQDHIVDKSKEVEPNMKAMKEVTEMPAREMVDGNLKKENDMADLQVGSLAEVFKARENPGRAAGQCNTAVKKGANDAKAMGLEGSNKENDKAQSSHGECKIDNDGGIKQSTEEKFEEVIQMEKKNLSDEEAVLIIQSAYRGYKVREWEPLKKLKQIAKIREQVADVTKSIQALQSSSSHQSDEKQRIIIGEIIMSLLLKLDTIQGLPPSLREVRKSVARELTRLQEMLDSSNVHASEGLNEEASIKLQDECTNTNNDVRGGEIDKEAKEVQSSNELSENNYQGHSPCVLDVISGSQGEVTSEFSLVDEMNTKVQTQVSSELETKMMEPEVTTHCKVEEDNSQGMIPEILEGNYESNSASLSEQSIEVPSIVKEMASSVINSERCLGDGAAGVVQSQMDENDKVVNEDVFVSQSEHPQNMERGKDEVPEGAQAEQILAAHAQQAGDHIESNMDNGVTLPENGALGVQPDPCEVLKEGPQAPNSVKLGVPDDKELLGDTNAKEEMEQAQVVASYDKQEILEPEKAEPMFSIMEESHGEDQSGPEVGDFENSVKDLKPKMTGEQLCVPGENSCPNHEPAGASEAESCQLAFLAVDKEEGQELHDAEDTTPEPISTATSQENEIPVDEVVTSLQVPAEDSEDHLDKLMATGGETGKEGEEAAQEEKVQYDELQSEAGNGEWVSELNEFETTKDKVPVEAFSAPIVAEQDEDEAEAYSISSTISHASNSKIIEENEVLKELMGKLIEAGKEQLTVMSNLSERVKVLEKMLSKKKKSTRTRRYRAPKVYGSACIKSSNDSVSNGAVGSVM